MHNLRVFGLVLLTLFLGGCVAHKNCRIDGDCGGSKFVSKGNVYGYPRSGFAGKPLRRGESIQQIWIGPYEDTDSNYHEPSYVYAVTKPGSWIGDPVKDIGSNQE